MRRESTASRNTQMNINESICSRNTETSFDGGLNGMAPYELPDAMKDNLEMLRRSMPSLENIYCASDVLIQTSQQLSRTLESAYQSYDIANSSVQAMISSSEMMVLNSISSLQDIYIPSINEALVDAFSNTTNADAIAASLSQLAVTVSDSIISPLVDWMSAFDFSSILDPLTETLGSLLERDRLKTACLTYMYQANWCPSVILCTDWSLICEIADIVAHTRPGKNRIKKIDSVIFAYYDDSIVEKMKKNWRKLDMPEYEMRIFHQCIQAYHRKEYVIPVVVLSTQWENIICRKASKACDGDGGKAKRYFRQLVDGNDYPEILSSFYNECIMFHCRSSESVVGKEGLPGRNSAAHGLFEKYPSRKAALNAILFTDFLLNLVPVSVKGC